MKHPYLSYPSRQFWSKAVATGYDASSVGDCPTSLIRSGDKIMTAGSCFAANLISHIEQAGFTHVKTEYTHPFYKKIPLENMSYGKFSAGYGNVYTVRQLYQLLLRSLGEFSPVEDRWEVDGKIIDPFRPALAYASRSHYEFDIITAAHLRAVKCAFLKANIFIFTLGLTEAWASKADGAVYPVCPGTILGEYDPKRHEFVNFDVNEVIADLHMFITRLRQLKRDIRVILTVSPVPLVATAEPRHILAATTYSKAVLRVAAETAIREFRNVYYFPAYEIITGPQAPVDYFESDRRKVSKQGVEAVMAAFFANCDTNIPNKVVDKTNTSAQKIEKLSARLSDAECEEAATER